MEEPIKTIYYKDSSINIWQDEFAESDMFFKGDDDLFLVAYHTDFYVERDEIITKEEARTILIGENEGRSKEIEKNYHIFGLEAYIHSGVCLALSYEGNFVDRQWDVSQLGLVLVSKKMAKDRKKAKQLAYDLIDDWNNYLSGNVYCYQSIDKETGEMIEGCGGFLGNFESNGLIEQAKDEIDYYVKNERKKKRKIYWEGIKKNANEMIKEADSHLT